MGDCFDAWSCRKHRTCRTSCGELPRNFGRTDNNVVISFELQADDTDFTEIRNVMTMFMRQTRYLRPGQRHQQQVSKDEAPVVHAASAIWHLSILSEGNEC